MNLYLKFTPSVMAAITYNIRNFKLPSYSGGWNDADDNPSIDLLLVALSGATGTTDWESVDLCKYGDILFYMAKELENRLKRLITLEGVAGTAYTAYVMTLSLNTRESREIIRCSMALFAGKVIEIHRKDPDN